MHIWKSSVNISQSEGWKVIANENSPHWILPIKIFFLDALRLFNVKFFGFRFVNNSIMNRIRFNKYTFLGFQILISDWLIYWDESGQSDVVIVETILDWQVFLFRNQLIYHFSFYRTRLDFFRLTTNALWLARNQSSFWLVKSSSEHKQSFEFCLPRRKIFQLVSHLDFFSNERRKIRVCLFFIRDLLTIDSVPDG